MATLLTAKQILINYDVLAPKDLKGAVAKRGTSHEFQDYAYRLAHDLNDLEHLQIYMKLAKTVPRYVLEKTYQFVADIRLDQSENSQYPSDSKGRLFMWKLKQVRADLQKQLDVLNYDYAHVLKKTTKLRDELSEKIISKNEGEDSIQKVLEAIDLKSKKSLIVGCTNKLLINNLITQSEKVLAIDVSKNIVSTLKKYYEQIKKIKFYKSDFLKKSLKTSYFDLIVLNNIWQLVPEDFELKFLKKIASTLTAGGKVIVNFKNCNENKQEWKNVIITGIEQIYFEKSCTSEKFIDRANAIGLKVVNIFENEKNKVFLLQK